MTDRELTKLILNHAGDNEWHETSNEYIDVNFVESVLLEYDIKQYISVVETEYRDGSTFDIYGSENECPKTEYSYFLGWRG